MSTPISRHTRNVLVFRSDLLSLSETFVKEQVLALRSWNATLAGLRFVDGLDLKDLRCVVPSGWLPNRLSVRITPALREFGLAPLGMRRNLSRLKPALIHVHFATDLVAMWPLLKSLEVPVLTTLHGYDINVDKEHWWRGGRASRRYPDRLLAIAREPGVGFIAVSAAIRNRAIDYGIQPEKIWIKHIGIDVGRFTPGDLPVQRRKRRILFVGRMVEKKGAPILIKAFANIRAKVADAELIMVGDGPLLESNTRLARTLNVPVTFLGAQSNAAVKRHMDESRVFCLPSITARDGDAEGLPIVILEAQACGLPVVGSAKACAGEALIHDKTGFYFEEGDLEALERALVQLLTDDDLVARMSAAARQHVGARFDLRHCTRELEELYENCAFMHGKADVDKAARPMVRPAL